MKAVLMLLPLFILTAACSSSTPHSEETATPPAFSEAETPSTATEAVPAPEMAPETDKKAKKKVKSGPRKNNRSKSTKK